MGTLAPIQLRRNLASFWTGTNPVLKAGEPAYALDTHILKIGDGGTAYNDLPAMANIADVTELNEHVEDLIAEMVAAGADIQEALDAANALHTWLVNIQVEIAADNDATVSEIEASNAITYNEIQADNDETVAEVGVIRDQTVVARQGAETARTDAQAAAELALSGQFAGGFPFGSSNAGGNVDTLLTPGVYKFSSAAGTGSTNLPANFTAGVLRVWNTTVGGAAMQEFLPYGNNAPAAGTFIRRAPGGAWRFAPTITIDNPSGEPGARISMWDYTNASTRELLTTYTDLGLTDLDLVMAPGSYRQSAASRVTLANHYPRANSVGTMDVSAILSNGAIQQRYYWSNAGHYQRAYGGGAWSVWRFIPSFILDSPTTEPGISVSLFDDINVRNQSLYITGLSLGSFDLNAVTLPGTYAQTSSALGTLARNYPREAVYGVLEVAPINVVGSIQQRFTPSANAGITGFYLRNRSTNGSTWSPWSFFAQQRIDETAGRAIYTRDDINNRDQLIYGDTGWRNIDDTLINGWTAVSLRIRRVGYQVFLKIEGLNPVARSATNAITLPVGFRDILAGGTRFVVFDAPTNTFSNTYRANVTTTVDVTSPTNASLLYGSGSWSTTEAWPTALPGSAVGTIPNL